MKLLEIEHEEKLKLIRLEAAFIARKMKYAEAEHCVRMEQIKNSSE